MNNPEGMTWIVLCHPFGISIVGHYPFTIITSLWDCLIIPHGTNSAAPMMKKLGWPTLFCHRLEIA